MSEVWVSVRALRTHVVHGERWRCAVFNVSGATTVTYSDVQGSLWPGTGNINGNPYFTNPAGGDYTINNPLKLSPCVDAANNADLPIDLGDLDWDGNNTEQIPEDLGGQLFGDDRIDRCSTVDMGAYEMHVYCSSG